jgi:hypothetical protein
MSDNMALSGTLEEKALELILPSQPCLYAPATYRRIIAELLEEVKKNTEQTGKTRKAFEAWISAPPYERDVVRFIEHDAASAWPGQYMDYEVELAWEAWQEGARFNGQ